MNQVDNGYADSIATSVVDGGGAGAVASAVIDGGPAGYKVYPDTQPVRTNHMLTQGDPRLFMGPDGTTLTFTGGQPAMDQGLTNLVMILLFTQRGWCGNKFLTFSIGSDFEQACDQPITRQSLNRVRTAAEAALKHPALGTVAVTVSNPESTRLTVTIRIQPPGSTVQEISLSRSAGAWRGQAQEH